MPENPLYPLSRWMGTSAKVIDQTCGHLVSAAEEYERGLLDANDARGEAYGHLVDTESGH